MNWQEIIINAHLLVTDSVSHARRLQSDRYFVWQEDGASDLMADNARAGRTISGTTDLFTKIEFDPWVEALNASFDSNQYIFWELNSIQYEEDTGFYHYEWRWQVIYSG